MENNNNISISVIVPMHTASDDGVALLKNAISSVDGANEIVIAVPKRKGFPFKAEEFGDNVRIVNIPSESTGSQEFCELVNGAVPECNGDWFSILEFDDTYSKTWFGHVRKYIEYKPETFMFMPITDLFEVQDGARKFIGYGNESPWASSFSETIGQIDHDCLQYYMDFYPSGSVFNRKEWLTLGGLKPHIKLSYWYEFMLRATDKGKTVVVIPKAGYTHILNRKDSISLDVNANMKEEERLFYVALAKEDFHFNEERDPSKYVFSPKKAEEVVQDDDEEDIEADKAKIMPLGAATKA